MNTTSAEKQETQDDSDSGFFEELSRLWRAIPDKSLFMVLFLAWVALFHFLGNSTLGYVKTKSLFGWWYWVETRLATDLDGRLIPWRILDSDEAHSWFLPLVVLALMWYRRTDLLALPKRVWWPSGLVLLAGILLHVGGYMIQQARVSVVGFFVGLYGIMGLLWGWRWLRAILFPFSLLAFCVPMGSAAEPITFPLRLLATRITAGLCHTLLGINVVQNGTQLFDAAGSYSYEVAAACSGIRSLTAILAFGVIYGYLAFGTTWRRLAVVGAGFPLAVVANVFRLTLIVLAAEAFGQKAGDYVHQSPWFSLAPYVPAIGGILLLGNWVREGKRKPAKIEELQLLGGAQQKS